MTLRCDVVIVGGGLAGLTLSLQLREALPDLHVVVLERRPEEPPLAAHKVGESTVELGAHYLSHTLGLRPLLEETQLRKFGLRFFFGNPAVDLAEADELGPSDFFPNRTYQLDRGRLERDLFSRAVEMGVDARRGCAVTGFSGLEPGTSKQVRYRDEDGEKRAECRWCVDASGRAALLKRLRSMERPSRHSICAAWFRLDEAIDIDEWSADADWKSRCNGVGRILSTNHLMGPGYWAWVIPLPEGRTSVGIVSDPEIVPLERVNSFDRFRNWAHTHQPLLDRALDDRRESVMDFRYLPDLARDCKQIWSSDGWALTGEAGVFADPFYSPGSDYIAIGNTFITDMIAGNGDPQGQRSRAKLFHALYRSFFANTIDVYRQQYPGFGDTRLMALKATWDIANYWAILAWMFFRGMLTDTAFLKSGEAELRRAFALNTRMQAIFRERAGKRLTVSPMGRFIDLKAIPILCEFNEILRAPGKPPDIELKANYKRLESLARVIESLLGEEGRPASGRQCEFLGDLACRLA